MRSIAHWLVAMLLLAAMAGCGAQRLEVERSEELDRLLAKRITFSVTEELHNEAMRAALRAANTPIEVTGGGPDPEATVSLNVHDQPLSDVIWLIYGDYVSDMCFALSEGSLEIRSSDAARRRYMRKLSLERHRTEVRRRQITDQMRHCDAIEVAVLGDKPSPDTSDVAPGFPIAAYDTQVRIVRVHRLEGESKVANLRTSVVAMLASREPGNPAFCHYPGFGLRCYRHRKLVMEASFCWKCGNYQATEIPEFISLPGDHTSDDLKQALTAITGPVTEPSGP